MFWRKKPEGMSPTEINESLRLIMAEVQRREAMGPVEREIDPLIQYGWTIEDMRKAFRVLARAIDAQSKDK